MNHVFVSHADRDKRVTKSICDALAAEGIPTWVSFRDIPSGANWDESIETALAQANSVVVIVSPSSVKSRYVRAEVEQAIRAQKCVVPVIIQPAELPLRWRMRQNVKWQSNRTKASVNEIARGLPHATASELREALDDSSRFDDVRSLILRHPEWLPIEFYMATHYSYMMDVNVLNGTSVDCFAARLDTVGPRACLYYLGSPYLKPIAASGLPSPKLGELLNRIRLHCTFLAQKMRQTHRLAPKRLFRSDLWQRESDFHFYTVMRVNLIIGRRRHYRGAAMLARQRIVAKVSEEMFDPRETCLGGLEMMSYDRILDAIPK